MALQNSTPKPIFPPMFIAYDPNAASIYDNWQKPEAPSLDTRLALEKAKKNQSPVFGASSASQNSIRSLISPRFRNRSSNRDPVQQARQHNSELPVCRIPEGLYSQIFMECAQLPLDDLENWSWMNVSYVCSSWRNAALRCRKLWTFIDFASPERTMISLDRAKGESLSIRAVVNRRNVRQLRSVFTTTPRINYIYLDSSFGDIQPLLEYLAHPNPTLTSLVINVSPEGPTSPCYHHPNFPLSGTQSKLRRVDLDAAPLYLLSYHCPSLTHLTLRNLPQSERQSDVLRFLSSLPQLQNLAVSQCTVQGRMPSRQVYMPNLRQLKVGGSLQQVADFLELITLTSFCQLSCSLSRLDNLSNDLWRLCQSIGAHSYASTKDVPLETLILTCNEVSTRFTTSNEPNPDFRQSIRIRAFGSNAKPGCAAFDISIGPGDQYITDDIMISTLSGIWRALVLIGVHTLSLQNIDIVTQKSWTQFLRMLPHLRVLDIRGYVPSGLLWALLLDELSSGAGIPRFLVPRLDDVYLYGVDCSSGGLMLTQKGQINSYYDLDDSRFLDVLVACLKHRRRHKMGLRSLTVTRCEKVSQKALDDAKQVVSNLVWDIRGKTKEEPSVSYRNMHPGAPRSDLRHYRRLAVFLS